MLTEASQMLSGLSRGAGLVLTAKNEVPLKHIEFIQLDPTARSPCWCRRTATSRTGSSTCRRRHHVAAAEASNFLNAHIAAARSPRPAPRSSG
jgi:heat-inducible transcriptional repressor